MQRTLLVQQHYNFVFFVDAIDQAIGFIGWLIDWLIRCWRKLKKYRRRSEEK